MTTYVGCSDLPIYNFMMYISTNDILWFVKDKGGKDLTESEKITIFNLSEIIVEEYREIILIRQKEYSKMINLELRFKIITSVLNLYEETLSFKSLTMLSELGLSFDESKPILPQIQVAKNRATGFKMKLRIAQANFKTRYKLTEDDLKKEGDRESRTSVEKNLDYQSLLLENNLETGYKIDPKTTSVLRWVNMLEMNEQKVLSHE